MPNVATLRRVGARVPKHRAQRRVRRSPIARRKSCDCTLRGAADSAVRLDPRPRSRHRHGRACERHAGQMSARDRARRRAVREGAGRCARQVRGCRHQRQRPRSLSRREDGGEARPGHDEARVHDRQGLRRGRQASAPAIGTRRTSRDRSAGRPRVRTSSTVRAPTPSTIAVTSRPASPASPARPSTRRSISVSDDLALPSSGAVSACQAAIGKSTAAFVAARSKALQKCWDGRLNGKHSGDCTPPAAGDGEVSRGHRQSAHQTGDDDLQSVRWPRQGLRPARRSDARSHRLADRLHAR